MIELIDMKKITSLISTLAITSIVFLPYSAFAQESVPAPEVPTTTTAPEVTTTSTDTSVQGTIPADLLEGSVNPQQDALQEAIQVIDENTNTATNTDIILPQATSTTENIEIPPAEEEVVQVIPEATTTPVADLSTEDLKPTKEYTFEINGSSIATNETPEWADGVDANTATSSDKVSEAPAISIQEASHILNVSGECSDPYYVVLIYKDAESYNSNPSSYIYNRAYPCENGHYSYALSELPFSLESGTFYLLVAGQGERGPWKPISALLPIGITVKTILPTASTTQDEPVQ
jgi:hypothetical protein